MLRLLALILLLTPLVDAAGDWPMLGHDLSRRGYVSLNQSYPSGDFVLKWSFQSNRSIVASPTAADVNGDGFLEVLFPCGNMLYVLDYAGFVVWNYSANGIIRSSPSVGDLDSDGVMEIVFGADDGMLRVLSGNGSIIWAFQTNGSIVVSPVLADMNSDGRLEIIFVSWDEYVYGLESSGRELWRYHVGDRVESSPAVGDIDGDNQGEIIFGSDSNLLYVLYYPPHKLWMYQTNANILTSPVVSDIDHDSSNEIVFGDDDGVLYALYYSVYQSAGEEVSRLEVLWNYTANNAIRSGPSVANLDSDSSARMETVFGSDDKMLYIIASNGSRLARYTVNKPVRSTPLIADLDADSNDEIIFGSDDKNVYGISNQGSTLWTFKADGMVRTQPIAVDLEGNNMVQIIFASSSGTLYALQNSREKSLSEADYLYHKAESYYVENDFINSKKFALDALQEYSDASYAFGISNANRLLGRISAMDLCNRAGVEYSKGNLNATLILASESDRIYGLLNLGNVSSCSALLSQSNADVYYLEAEFFYEQGNYTAALSYAEQARGIYEGFNDPSRVQKVDDLKTNVRISSSASVYYDKALSYYSGGSYDVASTYIVEAVSLYSQIGNNAGSEKASYLDRKINASRSLSLARSYFTQSNFKESYSVALESYKLFQAIDDEEGMASAMQIVNATQDYSVSQSILNKSRTYFNNGSLEEAMKYAEEAIRKCSLIKDQECIRSANNTLMDIERIYSENVWSDLLKFFALLSILSVVLVLLFLMRRKKVSVI